MKNHIKIFLIVFISIVVIYGLFFADGWIKGNFHVITENRAYRSRQLDKQLLKYYVTKYNIKSIISLRGAEPGKKWYDDELEVCSIYDITHYDLDLAMDKEPKKQDMETLINLFKTVPKPVFIHCLGGSDRTGLAATLWKIVMEKEDKEKASRHMLFFYGHMPFGKARVLDRWLWKTEIKSDGTIVSFEK